MNMRHWFAGVGLVERLVARLGRRVLELVRLIGVKFFSSAKFVTTGK